MMVTPHEPASSRRHQRGLNDRRVQQASVTAPWGRLQLAAASDRGRRQAVNEDSHSSLERPSSSLFVVADGVGGGAMAAQASRELVSQLHSALDCRPIHADAIRTALLEADREVARSIAAHTSASGAATVALCAKSGPSPSRWLVAWVGDCRVYRIGRTAEQRSELLTLDDTYRNLSEQPPPGGSLDDPARMVGNGAVSVPNVSAIDLHAGESLVLCSDGVHKHVGPHDIDSVLRESGPLVDRCRRLLELARANGSDDDATVLAVHRERTRDPRLAWAIPTVAVVAIALLLAIALLRPDGPAWRDAQPAPAPLGAGPADASLSLAAGSSSTREPALAGSSSVSGLHSRTQPESESQ